MTLLLSKWKSRVKEYSELLLDVSYYGYWFIALMVKIYYFQFNAGLNVHPVSDVLNKRMLTSSMAVLLIIFGFSLFLFYKRRRFGLFMVNVVLGLILFSDAIYFRYYETPVNLALIYQLGYVGDVSASIKSLFRPQDLVFIIDLPIYAIFWWIGTKLPKYPMKKAICWSISGCALVLGFVIFNHNYKVSNTILYNYDRNYAARDLGILYYHGLDIKKFSKEEIGKRLPMSKEDQEKIESFFEEKNNQLKGKQARGTAKDMNLIIVQVEAFQSFVMERGINGEVITPFLNKLIEDSYYFSNIYHQVAGGNTSDAEFMTNNSLYPAASGAAYFRYGYNSLPSIGHVLTEKGYKNYAAHAFRPSFWNRQTVYQSEGFDRFLSMNDFEMDEKIGWAVSDESFYRQTLDQIDTADPFYAFMVSLSSHHPYDGFINFNNINVGKYEGKQLGNFIKGARYDDYALETLFANLKEKGLYDNTIVAIYGDHSALFEDQASDVTEFVGVDYNPFEWQRLQRIPLIIHVPGQKGKRIETIGGQMDILPTVANLMGFDMPYALGKDLINTEPEEGYAVLRDSSVMLKDVMFLSKTSKVYEMKTGKILEPSTNQDRVRRLQDELQISDILLGKDYFKKVKK